MNAPFVSSFLAANRQKLFPNKLYTEADLERLLLSAPTAIAPKLQAMRFQNPTSTLLISALFGLFGIDRFAAKEILLGLLKLCTLGGCYVWWVIDIITAIPRCRKRNCKQLIKVIQSATITPEPAAPAGRKVRKAAAKQPVQPVPPVQPVQPVQHTVPVTHDADVFLSYSHRDGDALMPLFAALKNAGLSVWYDAGIRAGSEWEEEIIKQLTKASGFVFFVTESSLMSANCRDELYQARKRNKKFINVLLEDVDLSKPEFEWFDFRYSRYQQIPAFSMTQEEVVARIKSGLGM